MTQHAEKYHCTDYRVGGRYLHSKTRHPLTVRYIGPLPAHDDFPVDSNSGSAAPILWLGVEYDDPAHGKGHSGTYQGQQMFHCRQDGAGAFLKLVPGCLDRGRTLVRAFEERYGRILPTESQRPEHEQVDESVRLGTSGIVVEAPGLGRVQRKVGQLERLKEVGLEGEWVSELGGTEHQRRALRERLKGVHLLNLSGNLLSSWQEVESIASSFSGLKTLILNQSQLNSGIQSDGYGALPRVVSQSVTGLYLGDAGLTWREAWQVIQLFPNLQSLHINDNPLINSPFNPAFRMEASHLRTLSLAGCGLSDWDEIITAVGGLKLENLDLARTSFKTIPKPHPTPNSITFRTLSSLNLSDTLIRDWTSIDNLAEHLSNLQSLRIGSTASLKAPDDPPRVRPPLSAEMTGNDVLDRPTLIAKLASLQMLNASRIVPDERRDAEVSYVRQVSNAGLDTNQWGRFAELKEKHGIVEVEQVRLVKTDLRSKMITLKIIHAKRETFDLRVLPSLSIVALKKKIARKMDRNAERLHIWSTIQRGEEMVKNIEVQDGRDVEWWLSDGDTVLWTGGRVD